MDPAEYPARAARQWIPPSIPLQLLASGARGSPVDPERLAPADYSARAARQWIPLSIPPEQLASGSRPVSRQSCSSIPPERLASGSRRVSRQSGSPVDPSRRESHQSSPPVDPAEEYLRVARQWIPLRILARVARQWIPPSFPAARQWIPPSIPLSIVSRQSSSPVWFCLMSRPADSWGYISCW